MAVGNSLLASWDVDGVVRIFEYTGGVFVQLASAGGYYHQTDAASLAAGATPIPLMRWEYEDTEVVIIRTHNMSTLWMDKLTALGAAAGGFLIAKANRRGSFIGTPTINDATYYTHNVEALAAYATYANAANVNPSAWPGDGIGVVGGGPVAFGVSPDGMNLIVLRATDAFMKKRSVAGGAFGAWVGVPITMAASLVAWAPDNQGAVFVNSGENRAQSWFYDGTNWNYIHELVMPSGVGYPREIKMSGDRRLMAISFNNGGTYTTRIYRRAGSYYTFHQDISGFGNRIDFSADGVLLVDAPSRKVYIYNGDYLVQSVAAAVNLPSGVLAQTLSAGRTDAYGVSALFDAAVPAFADKTADLDNLFVTLLDSTGEFLQSAASFNEATNEGDAEITTGGWPAGGYQLQNVAPSYGLGYFALACDPVSHIVIDTTLSARYALIYDKSVAGGMPMIWVDLTNTRTVVRNREMKIDFRNNEFLKFSR